MQHRSYRYITLLSWVMAVFLLASCGAKRKVLYGNRPHHGTSTTGKSIPTDASDARGKAVSGSGIDNYAAILGVSVRDLKNNSLYSFIDKWLGSQDRNST